MHSRFSIRTAAVWLGVIAVGAGAVLTLAQRQSLSRMSSENRRLRAELGELDRLRAEEKEFQSRRNEKAELEQLREENRDLLRLRNEVHQLREQAAQTEMLRTANAQLLQALQNANLQPDQREKIAAIRKGGAVLGVFALSSSDPRSTAVNSGHYNGAVVMSIDPASPAATSGLKPGDIVVHVDGHPVESVGDLQSEMLTRKPGDTVTLDVIRNDSLIRIPVQTKAWPKG